MFRRIRTLASTAAVALACTIVAPATPAVTPKDFVVKEAGGIKEFQLSKARGDYVALHFLLKTDCPICLRVTREYAAKADTVPRVRHIFLKPDAEEDTVAWAQGLKSDNPNASPVPIIYRDPDAQLAEAFGIPDGYRFHGEMVHYPAFVLLGPDGKEVFRYVGKKTQDRFTFDRFAVKMSELKRLNALEHYNLGEDGLALGGYDPVSYFKEGPKKGKKDVTAEFAGAIYTFADEASREAFLRNPDRYLPAYGGWCATAMAEGKKVEVDPRNYKITNGRLFLFYKGLLQNAINPWNKDEEALTATADKEWRTLSGE